MTTKTIIQENWMHYTMHSSTITIPQSFGRPEKTIELRRSMMPDAAFIIVVDGVPKEVVPQNKIWKTLKEISEELFRAFGIFKPVIGWNSSVGGVKISVDDTGNFIVLE